MKKGQNGWLLQHEEDGESHNSFSWTGWMTRHMDGKSFMTTTSFTICNVDEFDVGVGASNNDLNLGVQMARALDEAWQARDSTVEDSPGMKIGNANSN
jgi:hypothetical protein